MDFVVGRRRGSYMWDLDDSKRLPLFPDRLSAEEYTRQYYEYCHLLTEAGLRLPEHQALYPAAFLVSTPRTRLTPLSTVIKLMCGSVTRPTMNTARINWF